MFFTNQEENNAITDEKFLDLEDDIPFAIGIQTSGAIEVVSDGVNEHNIDDTNKVRNTALTPFKEVIYYNFDTILERERGKASMDLELLNQLIARVEEAGGSVRSVTMDMGNKTLLSNCGVNI